VPRRAFRVAYDGRPYFGFQRQPDATTVEGELFAALGRLDATDGGKPPGYAAAGRTDAGVSARAQTVAFDAPEWLTPYVLNGELPHAIRVWAHADAPPDFHATHDAKWREYRYFWLAPTADDDRASRALDALCGEHDFHNLTPDDENTVRDLSGDLERSGEFLVVTLRSGGFARELVRRAVSVVADVAGGASFDRIETVLGSNPVEGPDGVAPADPQPLVLHDVRYDLDFVEDEDAADDARMRFARLRDDRRALTTVAAHVADEI
jgi:tRNA pseudouridine38-40 synthase